MRESHADLDAFPDGVEPNAVLQVMGTARSMRRLRPDPVPEPLVQALLWAATRAPSPTNSQLWHFVVVRSPEQRAALARSLERFRSWATSAPVPRAPSQAQIHVDALGLLERLADAPIVIVICAENAYPAGVPETKYVWSATSTAAQNLLLAARSLGLGATLTMAHVLDEAAAAEVLGLPDNVRIGCMIPIGWPARPFGPVRRRPVTEVRHDDRW